jgi:ribose transport system substrate-binding protein
MSLRSTSRSKRFATGLVAGVAVLALAGCTSNDSSDDNSSNDSGDTAAAPAGSNDEAGDTVVIGFSAPAADHDWMGSITESAKNEA